MRGRTLLLNPGALCTAIEMLNHQQIKTNKLEHCVMTSRLEKKKLSALNAVRDLTASVSGSSANSCHWYGTLKTAHNMGTAC